MKKYIFIKNKNKLIGGVKKKYLRVYEIRKVVPRESF